MKSKSEIDDARCILNEKLCMPKLNDYQMVLLTGMLIALVWVVEGEHCEAMKELLAGGNVEAGKDPSEGLDILHGIRERLK